MTERTHSAAIAILPCNDIRSAERWWNRLGFTSHTDEDNGDYRMLSDGQGAEVHLQPATEGWLVGGRNPFGVYLYTDRVDEIARAAGTAAEHKPWGMYECALNGPDDLLVRVGRPSRQR